MPSRLARSVTAIRWGALACLALALTLALGYAPIDPEMGLVQKLIYLHLPAAIASFAMSLGVFVAGLGSLWTHQPVWGRIGHAAALATLISSLIVLVTGMLWAHHVWDMWWTWSPRLTFTLVMCVLYAAYLAMHRLPKDPAAWETRRAVFGCVVFLDVPLVYAAIRLLPDVHPTALPLSAPMRTTLLPWYALAALLCAHAIIAAIARDRTGPAARPPRADRLTPAGTVRPQT